MDRGRTRRGLMRAVGGGFTVALASRASVASAVAQDGTPCPATTAEEAEAVAEAYFAAFNAGDADALGAVLAPDYRHHGALVTDQDRELHMERLRINRAAFPDGAYELVDIFAQGDLVAVRHIFTGTLQGAYAGIEPSGQPVAVRSVHIHRVACGKIVETWNSGDALGLLRQIGALPSPGPLPRTPLEAVATPTVTSPKAGNCPPGTPEENAAIGRRWTEDALDNHNLNLLDEFVAEDLVHHAGLFVDEIGRDALKEDLQALIDAFPDVRFSADVVVASEDRVAVRWTGRGTHLGELQGLATTGRPVVFTGIN